MANRLNWQIISTSVDVSKYNIYRSIIGVESANDMPFVLSDGMNLTLKIDDGALQTVTFNALDFTNIALPTMAEILAVLNDQITGSVCHEGASHSVFIRSASNIGSVQIFGGTANAVFGFSTARYSEKSAFIKIAEVTYHAGVMEYVDNDGAVYDWYRITAIDNMLVESAPTIEKQAGPTRDPICIVYGTIQDPKGFRLPDQKINAVIEYPPSVNGVTTSWVSRDIIEVLSLIDGTFELELLQNAAYRVEIPSIEFCRVVKIPALASANLFSLDFEQKDLHNGGETISY